MPPSNVNEDLGTSGSESMEGQHCTMQSRCPRPKTATSASVPPNSSGQATERGIPLLNLSIPRTKGTRLTQTAATVIHLGATLPKAREAPLNCYPKRFTTLPHGLNGSHEGCSRFNYQSTHQPSRPALQRASAQTSMLSLAVWTHKLRGLKSALNRQ